MSSRSELVIPSRVDVYGARGPVVMGATWMLFTLTTMLMGLRYYVKLGMKRPGKWPLIWLTASWVAAVCTQIFCTVAVRMYGVGNHTELLAQAGTIRAALFWNWMTSAFALLSIGIGKLAAVVLILAIQGQTNTFARVCLYTLAAINMLVDFGDMIGLWFQCSPVPRLWDRTIEGECNGAQSILILSMVAGGVNAVSDIILAMYPAYIIWRLRLKNRIKVGICTLMGLSVFTGACASVKISKLPAITNTTDPTYEIAELLLWGLTEMWVVILVALIPPTYPLVQSYIEKQRSSSAYHSSRNRGKSSYLGRDRFSGGLRGDTKGIRSHGYVDHTSQFSMGEDSTTNLPDNCIMMKQDFSIEKEHSANHRELGELTPATSHDRDHIRPV